MAGNDALGFSRRRAGCQQIAAATQGRIGFVLAIAAAISCRIREQLAARTAITFILSFPAEAALAHHARPGRRRIAIASDAEDIAILETLGDACGRVAGIKTDGGDLKTKAFALTIQTTQVDDRVVDIGRGGIGIGDDPEPSVDRAMVEIEEALGLPSRTM